MKADRQVSGGKAARREAPNSGRRFLDVCGVVPLLKSLLILLAALACQGCGRARQSVAEEKWLFERLDRVVHSGNVTQASIVKEFDLPPVCIRAYCNFTIDAATGFKGAGSLRQSDGGIIFELSELPAGRIRRSEVQSYFNTTVLEEGCCDAPCWYLNSYNDWGLLAFGVRSPSQRSISSVVINTERYGRALSARAKAGANVR